MSGDVIVRMWEVRGEAATFADLIAWVCDTAVPRIEVEPLHIASEVYSSTDHRVVVVSKWRSSPTPMPDPPKELVARKPHAWDFTQVDR